MCYWGCEKGDWVRYSWWVWKGLLIVLLGIGIVYVGVEMGEELEVKGDDLVEGSRVYGVSREV